MRSRLVSTVIAVCVAALTSVGAARSAAAQAALDDDDEEISPTTPTASEATVGPQTTIGVGLRIRQMIVPKSLIELFVEHAEGSSSQTGFGFELARRKGDFEVQFGLEWDNIYIKPGLWVDKGNTIPQDEPDFVEFDGPDEGGYLSTNRFGWVTAEVTFLNHTEIVKQLTVRYGGGAGIGIIKGHVRRTDYVCEDAVLETADNHCHPYGGAENVNNPYDIPPVMLIVNAIIGVQIRPVDKVFINVEGGLRTFPFFGITGGAYF
jgi:hypothetical protein